MDLFAAAPTTSLPLKYAVQSNDLEDICMISNIARIACKIIIYLFFIPRLKIDHSAHGCYAFILENGAVANNLILKKMYLKEQLCILPSCRKCIKKKQLCTPSPYPAEDIYKQEITFHPPTVSCRECIFSSLQRLFLLDIIVPVHKKERKGGQKTQRGPNVAATQRKTQRGQNVPKHKE